MEIKLNNLTLENVVSTAETSFDAKLTAFATLLNTDYEKKLSLFSKDILSKVNSVHNKIEKLCEDTQRKQDTVPIHCANGGELQQEMDRISNEIKLKGVEYQDVTNSLKFTEEQLQESISGVEGKLNSVKTEIAKNSGNLKKLEGNLQNLESRLIKHSKTNSENPSEAPPSENRHSGRNSTELLLCFDSNAKFIDRKRLWKVKNSELIRCGNLHEVAKVFESDHFTSLKYILLNVGVNDLDYKDNTQVFGELELLTESIRTKYRGIKFIISEITPRNDERDDEVKACNILLKEYAKNHPDVTLTIHENLRDPEWSMFSDEKHIRKLKVGRFAANLIKALKTAYEISDKRELFDTMPSVNHQVYPRYQSYFSNTNQPIKFKPRINHVPQPLMNVNIPYNDTVQFNENVPVNNNKSMGIPRSLEPRLRRLANYPVQTNEVNYNPEIYSIQQEFEDFMKRVFSKPIT